MNHSSMHLLTNRRFLPLFITQAMGALNDNIFKNALVILITYVLAEKSGLSTPLVVTLASALFIFPFFLFSAIAGQIADKYEKPRLIRYVKEAEIVIMFLAAISFQLESTWLLLFVLFLMGAQSSFFGPLKYGVLPELLTKDELIAGNGLVVGITFVAILAGTMIGGLLILGEYGSWLISILILVVALTGWFSSRYIPQVTAGQANIVIERNLLKGIYLLFKSGLQRKDLMLIIGGISWFWFVGATLLAQFPVFGKQVLHGNEEVVTLLLLMFALGIATGSIFCNWLLKGTISLVYVPIGAMGIGIFGIDLYFAIQLLVPTEKVIGIAEFHHYFQHARILTDLFFMAVAGGLYIVPLNTMLQDRSPAEHRARFIGINNMLNALFMVLSAGLSAVIYASGYGVADIFLTVSLGCFAVVLYIYQVQSVVERADNDKAE